MASRSLVSRVLAVSLIVAIQLIVLPVRAGTPASISGEILSAGTKTPLAGAVVRVHDPRSGDLFASPPTDDRGSFSISDLPPATYNLAVEANGGVYLAQSSVTLAPGQTHSVRMALMDKAAPSPEDEEDEDDDGMTLLDNPLAATGTVLGIAFGLGWLINESTDDKNPGPTSEILP